MQLFRLELRYARDQLRDTHTIAVLAPNAESARNIAYRHTDNPNWLLPSEASCRSIKVERRTTTFVVMEAKG